MPHVGRLTMKRSFVWLTILVWVMLAGVMSMAPSAQDQTVNTGENDLPEDAPSAVTE
ncbi:hypothetical protein [Alkalicoccus chagannorensis]|uniref:hypothetical protein n=1 Tax=Alkalicoccus chagannorensis TaxID=427072 RepID=UPI0004262090|nr:hypothetical protein [Alkalicoccus chagannorensis]